MDTALIDFVCLKTDESGLCERFIELDAATPTLASAAAGGDAAARRYRRRQGGRNRLQPRQTSSLNPMTADVGKVSSVVPSLRLFDSDLAGANPAETELGDSKRLHALMNLVDENTDDSFKLLDADDDGFVAVLDRFNRYASYCASALSAELSTTLAGVRFRPFTVTIAVPGRGSRTARLWMRCVAATRLYHVIGAACSQLSRSARTDNDASFVSQMPTNLWAYRLCLVDAEGHVDEFIRLDQAQLLTSVDFANVHATAQSMNGMTTSSSERRQVTVASDGGFAECTVVVPTPDADRPRTPTVRDVVANYLTVREPADTNFVDTTDRETIDSQDKDWNNVDVTLYEALHFDASKKRFESVNFELPAIVLLDIESLVVRLRHSHQSLGCVDRVADDDSASDTTPRLAISVADDGHDDDYEDVLPTFEAMPNNQIDGRSQENERAPSGGGGGWLSRVWRRVRSGDGAARAIDAEAAAIWREITSIRRRPGESIFFVEPLDNFPKLSGSAVAGRVCRLHVWGDTVTFEPFHAWMSRLRALSERSPSVETNRLVGAVAGRYGRLLNRRRSTTLPSMADLDRLAGDSPLFSPIRSSVLSEVVLNERDGVLLGDVTLEFHSEFDGRVHNVRFRVLPLPRTAPPQRPPVMFERKESDVVSRRTFFWDEVKTCVGASRDDEAIAIGGDSERGAGGTATMDKSKSRRARLVGEEVAALAAALYEMTDSTVVVKKTTHKMTPWYAV